MSILAMNISIRNNKLLLSKREKFKRVPGGYKNHKTEYDLPKATQKDLRDLRKRLKEEHRIRLFVTSLLTLIVFVVLITILNYFSDEIRYYLWY
jgi:uncharacterized protein (DUF2461 family)